MVFGYLVKGNFENSKNTLRKNLKEHFKKELKSVFRRSI